MSSTTAHKKKGTNFESNYYKSTNIIIGQLDCMIRIFFSCIEEKVQILYDGEEKKRN